MENRKNRKPDQKLELPEQVLQHIQSFLTTKEAACTSVLSKSWYNSWLSRPILDFNECDFPNVPYPNINLAFLNFMTYTLQKRDDLNLIVKSFVLRMNAINVKSSSVATESIVKAIKMGVKNVDIEIKDQDRKYVLPMQVFESESLKRLSVTRCEIERISCGGGRVKCTKLESISLSDVAMDDELINDVLLECPLIESLSLYRCDGELGKVDMSRLVKLEELSVVRQLNSERMVGHWQQHVPDHVSVMDFLSDVAGFKKLSCLVLEYVEIDSMLFHDFSNKFPCLEDLTIWYCSGCMSFDISSHSLKYVTLASGRWETLDVILDVPNILKFKFTGVAIPYLTFTRCSSNWESDISIDCWNSPGLDISWFKNLKNFLTNLSGSKISLSIGSPTERLIKRLLDFQDSPNPPIVENLTLETRYSGSFCSLFLDALFWSLQPKFITQHFYPQLHKFGRVDNKNDFLPQNANNKLLQLLCKKLMDLENGNVSSSSGAMICWNKLEEVNAEYLEYTFMKWQPQPWKTLLDDIILTAEEEAQVRFRLKWGPLATIPKKKKKNR